MIYLRKMALHICQHRRHRTLQKRQVYEETLEDNGRFNEQPALPFNAYGTMALARSEFETNSGSSQFFFLLKARRPTVAMELVLGLGLTSIILTSWSGSRLGSATVIDSGVVMQASSRAAVRGSQSAAMGTRARLLLTCCWVQPVVLLPAQGTPRGLHTA